LPRDFIVLNKPPLPYFGRGSFIYA